MLEGKFSDEKEMQMGMLLEAGTTTQYLTRANIVLSLMMGMSDN